jgi:periodic tryptophan protein 1
MISALAWVRKGAAAEKPEKYILSEDEFQRIQQATANQLDEATDAVAHAIEAKYVSSRFY